MQFCKIHCLARVSQATLVSVDIAEVLPASYLKLSTKGTGRACSSNLTLSSCRICLRLTVVCPRLRAGASMPFLVGGALLNYSKQSWPKYQGQKNQFVHVSF
jgi:hypothetical protein